MWPELVKLAVGFGQDWSKFCGNLTGLVKFSVKVEGIGQTFCDGLVELFGRLSTRRRRDWFSLKEWTGLVKSFIGVGGKV